MLHTHSPRRTVHNNIHGNIHNKIPAYSSKDQMYAMDCCFVVSSSSSRQRNATLCLVGALGGDDHTCIVLHAKKTQNHRTSRPNPVVFPWGCGLPIGWPVLAIPLFYEAGRGLQGGRVGKSWKTLSVGPCWTYTNTRWLVIKLKWLRPCRTYWSLKEDPSKRQQILGLWWEWNALPNVLELRKCRTVCEMLKEKWR